MTSSPHPTRSSGLAFAVRMMATAFGLGYLPKAPGTWGSLAGLPLALWLSTLTPQVSFCALVVATLVAIWVAQAAEGAFSSQHDAKEVVIDEVVGIGWTFWVVPVSAGWLVVGFILFRLLDALKPGPIALLDRHVPGGLGVVIDDVAAGLIACALLHAAHPFLSVYLGG